MSNDKPNNLKFWMDQIGVTQEQLADNCGVNVRTIRRYIGGEAVPNVYVAIKIANFLKLDVAAVWF